MKTLYFLMCIAYANCFYIGSEPSTKDKIVGGDNVEIEYVPYQASLLYKGSHFCGAAIIAESWILTAGHCIELGYTTVNTTNLLVRTGTSQLTGSGSRFKVEKIIVHPEYNPRNFDNDITLLKLLEPIRFNYKQRPIQIAQPNDIPQTGELLHISGFGQTKYENKSYSPVLKLAYVPVVDQRYCEIAYIRDPITENMFCAGNGKADACQGDSGGPGVINNKLAAVVSTGSNCASEEFPGVYTRVYKYYNWIMQTTNSLH